MSRTYRATVYRKKVRWLPGWSEYKKFNASVADDMRHRSGKEYNPHYDNFDHHHNSSENVNVYERRPCRTKEREIIQHIKHGEIDPDDAMFPLNVYSVLWW